MSKQIDDFNAWWKPGFGALGDKHECLAFQAYLAGVDAERERKCGWAYHVDGFYQTECGQAFQLSNEEGLTANGFVFCYHCGGRIQEQE